MIKPVQVHGKKRKTSELNKHWISETKFQVVRRIYICNLSERAKVMVMNIHKEVYEHLCL